MHKSKGCVCDDHMLHNAEQQNETPHWSGFDCALNQTKPTADDMGSYLYKLQNGPLNGKPVSDALNIRYSNTKERVSRF